MRSVQVLCLAVLFFLNAMEGCSDGGDDMQQFKEFFFEDRIAGIISGDSVNIVVLQSIWDSQLGIPPCAVTHHAGLRDTVKLLLTVQYGGYTLPPSPSRLLEILGDSMRLKYGGARYCRFCKSSGIVGSETLPRRTYYRIQDVEVRVAPGRRIRFQSRFVQ
jgi:hypothetical protein